MSKCLGCDISVRQHSKIEHLVMSKCLGCDISVRQQSKIEHLAPCHIQAPSRYD